MHYHRNAAKFNNRGLAYRQDHRLLYKTALQTQQQRIILPIFQFSITLKCKHQNIHNSKKCDSTHDPNFLRILVNK